MMNARTINSSYLSVVGCFVCDTIYSMIYSIIYSAMYLISCCQIKYNQITKCIFSNSFVGTLSNTTKNGGGQFELFCSNQNGLKETTSRQISATVKMDENTILFYSNTQENGQQDKVMIRNGRELHLDVSNKLVNYTRADYSFISIDLVLEDGTVYKISLNNADENYYIVENVIDRVFVAYYAVKYLNFSEPPQKYTLNIVDNNADFFTMTQDDSIHLSTLSTFGKSGAKS